MESHGALLYDQPGTNQYIALQSLEIIYFEKMNLIVLYFIIFLCFVYIQYTYIYELGLFLLANQILERLWNKLTVNLSFILIDCNF